MQNKKTVLLCVSSSIAAYKIATLASMLVKKNYDVNVLMTKNACNFINPITFETLTGNKCIVDSFDRNFQFDVAHISLAHKTDLVIIAPATADIIGKLANGIADDMPTTTVMACDCKKIFAPAMNVSMYHNNILQDNIKKLLRYGFEIIAPQNGYLACGDIGDGKMAEPETIFEYIEKELAFKKDLKGKKILVTAGPTRESLDPVRYITNRSTGKMGYEIARAAMLRGAEVTLISGPVSIKDVPFVNKISVTSAEEMFQATANNLKNADIIIKSAAVADYRPKTVSAEKIKKSDGEISLPMERSTDILAYVGANRTPDQYVCGFSMETENMLENSRAKLCKKNIDMIAANNLKVEGAGFGVDTNVITLITKDNEIRLEKMLKSEVAHRILDEILKNLN